MSFTGYLRSATLRRQCSPVARLLEKLEERPNTERRHTVASTIRAGTADGAFWCACEKDGVTLRQWGQTEEEAFERLMATVDLLSH